MVDVSLMPDRAAGYVPTPALVFPVEFTMPLDAYREMGGYMADVVTVEQVQRRQQLRVEGPHPEAPWPLDPLRRAK